MATGDHTTRFRADIEGLRAVAVLGVLAFHAGVPHLGGGYVGVDVFYVISGFLITGLMLKDRTQGEHGGFAGFTRFLTAFYARRVRRILPAATLVLLVTLLGALLVQNALENASVAGDARSSALFFSNIRYAWGAADYFAAGSAPSPFLQYWSLSLEEQFYLVWPVVFFVLFAIATRRHRSILMTGTLVIVIGSFVLSVWLMRTEPVRAFYLLPPRAWELGAGALLALHHDRFAVLPGRVRALLSTCGLLAIVVAMVAYTEATPFPGWTAILPILGTTLVIAAGCGQPSGGPCERLLASRVMRLIGRYSFSLYLWHWPVLVLKVEHVKWVYLTWTTRTAWMLALSVPAAAATFHLVEDPVRRARQLRGHDARTLVVGVVMIATAIAGAMVFEHLAERTPLSTDRMVTATSGRLGATVVPTDFVPKNLVPSLAESGDRAYVQCGSPCLVGPPDAPRRVVVFGNSHAHHWGAAIEVAARQLATKIELVAPGGCSSYLVPVELLGAADKDSCDERRERTFASIAADPPAVVVLSNMSLDVFQAHPDTWERGVRDAIRRIPKASAVLVFAETPRGTESIPLCLAKHVQHAERCDQKWPTEINNRLATIAREEGAHFVDLRPLFCSATRCPAITEDTLIYGDTNHLTVPFSKARGAWLAGQLSQVMVK